ncbi:MAG: hypothetical protein HUK06_00620 [Bacteroidaceae bacterium]|nr:hypothetical protein [Bacteroidaceae bacterium]
MKHFLFISFGFIMDVTGEMLKQAMPMNEAALNFTVQSYGKFLKQQNKSEINLGVRNQDSSFIHSFTQNLRT